MSILWVWLNSRNLEIVNVNRSLQIFHWKKKLSIWLEEWERNNQFCPRSVCICRLDTLGDHWQKKKKLSGTLNLENNNSRNCPKILNDWWEALQDLSMVIFLTAKISPEIMVALLNLRLKRSSFCELIPFLLSLTRRVTHCMWISCYKWYKWDPVYKC